MKKFKLSTLTESKSFLSTDEETKELILQLLQKAIPGVQTQAIRLCESAAKGGEVAAVLTYLKILNSSDYFTRPCRATTHPVLAPITSPATSKKDDLSGYRPTSQILEILTRFPDGICRKEIMNELTKAGIERHETNVGDSLARLRRKRFIHWEKRSSAERKGLYYVYFLIPANRDLYAVGNIQPKSVTKIKELARKGYSVTEIALRCGLPREVVEEKVTRRSRRKAS